MDPKNLQALPQNSPMASVYHLRLTTKRLLLSIAVSHAVPMAILTAVRACHAMLMKTAPARAVGNSLKMVASNATLL